jgi:hypothetical protein
MSKKAEVSPAQARLSSWKDSFTTGVKSPTDLLNRLKTLKTMVRKRFAGDDIIEALVSE